MVKQIVLYTFFASMVALIGCYTQLSTLQERHVDQSALMTVDSLGDTLVAVEADSADTVVIKEREVCYWRRNFFGEWELQCYKSNYSNSWHSYYHRPWWSYHGRYAYVPFSHSQYYYPYYPYYHRYYNNYHHHYPRPDTSNINMKPKPARRQGRPHKPTYKEITTKPANSNNASGVINAKPTTGSTTSGSGRRKARPISSTTKAPKKAINAKPKVQNSTMPRKSLTPPPPARGETRSTSGTSQQKKGNESWPKKRRSSRKKK